MSTDGIEEFSRYSIPGSEGEPGLVTISVGHRTSDGLCVCKVSGEVVFVSSDDGIRRLRNTIAALGLALATLEEGQVR